MEKFIEKLYFETETKLSRLRILKFMLPYKSFSYGSDDSRYRILKEEYEMLKKQFPNESDKIPERISMLDTTIASFDACIDDYYDMIEFIKGRKKPEQFSDLVIESMKYVPLNDDSVREFKECIAKCTIDQYKKELKWKRLVREFVFG